MGANLNAGIEIRLARPRSLARGRARSRSTLLLFVARPSRGELPSCLSISSNRDRNFSLSIVVVGNGGGVFVFSSHFFCGQSA